MDNGGFTPMGFGRIPSQQNKIDEKSELGNLVKQYRTAAIIAFVLLAFIYVSANLMFGGSDWYEVVNIIEVATSAIVLVFTLRVLNEKYEGWYILGDENRVYLNTNTAIASIIGIVFLAYVHANSTDFLVVLFRFPEEKGFIEIIASVLRTAIIFFTIALVAPTIAILFRLIVKELPDQYHGALEVKTNADKLSLDWARFEEDRERYWSNREIVDQLPDYSDKKTEKPVLVFGNVERSQLPSPDNLHTVAMAEFLDGIRDGQWSTDERSWKGKRLRRSGYSLTAIGDTLRDSLIKARWAHHNHPTKKNLGWQLLRTPDETKIGYLYGGINGDGGYETGIAPQDAEGAASEEWSPDTEQ